jgi:hypothetical protein
MRKLFTISALSIIFFCSTTSSWSKPANKSAVIKVVQITSERVCVPQAPGVLETGILCGNGIRMVAESKDFYIEAVSLGAVAEIQPTLSVGEHFAAILPGNFLSIVDSGDADKAKIVSSFNIEILKPKQEIKR